MCTVRTTNPGITGEPPGRTGACRPVDIIGLDQPIEIVTRPVDVAEPKTLWGLVTAYEVPLTYKGTQKTDVEVTL